eukprot:1649680-Prymnesium_polylepis.1
MAAPARLAERETATGRGVTWVRPLRPATCEPSQCAQWSVRESGVRVGSAQCSLVSRVVRAPCSMDSLSRPTPLTTHISYAACRLPPGVLGWSFESVRVRHESRLIL